MLDTLSNSLVKIHWDIHTSGVTLKNLEAQKAAGKIPKSLNISAELSLPKSCDEILKEDKAALNAFVAKRFDTLIKGRQKVHNDFITDRDKLIKDTRIEMQTCCHVIFRMLNATLVDQFLDTKLSHAVLMAECKHNSRVYHSDSKKAKAKKHDVEVKEQKDAFMANPGPSVKQLVKEAAKDAVKDAMAKLNSSVPSTSNKKKKNSKNAKREEAPEFKTSKKKTTKKSSKPSNRPSQKKNAKKTKKKSVKLAPQQAPSSAKKPRRPRRNRQPAGGGQGKKNATEGC